MNNLRKLYILASSMSLLALTIGLISCSTQKQISDKNNTSNDFDLTRTIPKEENTKILAENNENLGKYDFNTGIITNPPIGEFDENNLYEIYENNEQLFTLEEVQNLSNKLAEQYNENLKLNSYEYEKYIENLTNEYINLENEFIALINDLSNTNNNSQNNNNSNTEIENEEISSRSKVSDNFDNEQKFNSREEEVNYIYNKALETISSKLDTFEPIQGQAPKSIKEVIKNDNNDIEEISLIEDNPEEEMPLNAENIFKQLSDNISLPKYISRYSSILTFEYKFPENSFSDFKLVSSETYDNNFFEMLIIKPTNITEEELIIKIKDRINSIITMISENTNEEINIQDKITLINIDDYILFCFSNINDKIIDFLEIV